MILPKKPQILYAPMLATFGGGSSRGFGRGIGSQKFPYNPFVMSWDGGRGSGNLTAYSPEAIVKNYSTANSRFQLANSTEVSTFMDSQESIMMSTKQNKVYVSDGSYGNILEFDMNGYQMTNITRSSNSNHGYGPAFNYASAFYGDDIFGNIRGGSAAQMSVEYASSLSASGWSTDTNVRTGSMIYHNEDTTYRAGKYLFAIGYGGIDVWDLSQAPYRPDTSNHKYQWSATVHAIVISPRDNMLGMLSGGTTNGVFWDYDEGVFRVFNSGLNSNWNSNDNAGTFMWFYAQTPSDTFDHNNYSRSNYKIVSSDYNAALRSDYNGGNTYSSCTWNWRAGTYNAEEQKMYLLGTNAGQGGSGYSEAYGALLTDVVDSNTSGNSFSTDIYLRNRGPFRGDMFSHKLTEHTVFDTTKLY